MQMQFFFGILTLLLLAYSVPPVASVLYGDEGYAALDGKFWAFYSGGVAIVDHETCTIDSTITMDDLGNPLPAGWSDGIYMQLFEEQGDDHEDHDHDRKLEHVLEGYVLINSRINRENDVGDQVSDVYVFSTKENKVASVVEVGPRVVHSYGVHQRNEFWTHSDGDGHFYVVDLKDLTLVESKVQAHSALPFHGKLLWDEDNSLGSRGFATATGEQFLFEINIEDAELVRSFDYSTFVESGFCGGLHAISYSAVNMHVYCECSGGGGILEFDVSNDDIKFVHQHFDQTGALYETPDGSFIVATNKGGNKMHVFSPQGTGVKSSLAYDVSVPGHPSTVDFYPTDSINGGADFIACMPLTGNPNKQQIDPVTGNVVCDYYTTCSGALSPEDILQGICLHSENPDGPNQLMRVTEVVADDVLCSRCADQANFDNTTGTCTCTPECGSCDPVLEEVDLSKTGVACVDLGAVVDGAVDSATLIPDAGAVRQGAPYGSSDECTFGRTYRSHKRGLKYSASVSNFPQDSLVIVDMSTQTVSCQVDLPGTPARVVWVPNEAQEVAGVGPASFESNDGPSGSPVALFSAAAFFASFVVLLI